MKPSVTNNASDKRRILVVEDEMDIRLGTTITLRAMGYDVVAVANGQQCIDMVERETFDAILMDIRMPVMDGLSAMSILQKNDETHDIPIIIVSASPGDQGHALDNGARFFIRKPFASASIGDALRSVFSEQQCLSLVS